LPWTRALEKRKRELEERRRALVAKRRKTMGAPMAAQKAEAGAVHFAPAVPVAAPLPASDGLAPGAPAPADLFAALESRSARTARAVPAPVNPFTALEAQAGGVADDFLARLERDMQHTC
jgi:hypothetical protein